MTLENLFTPHSLAVIGSTSPGKLGAELIQQIVDGGFAGPVYAVNPKAQGARGVPGYASIAEIGAPVDLAIIASPAASAAGVLEECGVAGIHAAVVITSGVGEVGNRAGEDELVRIARQHGIRMIGPNCAGIANTRHKLFPTLEWRPPEGEVALVTQSGALGGVILAMAAEVGLGISKFVSYGNGADLAQEDLLRYLSTDPETKVVTVYIESVRNGRLFMEALAECAAAKPVIVIKAGRTDAGRRATASHTGSMAGSDAVYDAAIRACGALRVTGVEEMLDLCRAFVAVPGLPEGKRVAIVTNSGGPGVLAADRAAELGLEIPEPSVALKEQLRAFLPPIASLRNPIDLTVEGSEEGFRRTLAAMLAEEYDAAIAINVGTGYLDNLALGRGAADGAAESGKPLLANFQPAQLVDAPVKHLASRGIPNFASGERAAAALARMAEYAQARSRPAGAYQIASRDIAGAPDRLFGGRNALLEPEAMAWLKREEMPVPAYAHVRSAKDAVEAARELGFPVVMKVVSPDILHKSDRGGVAVGLASQKAVRAAFKHIRQNTAGCDFRGVVLYPMVKGARETLLGFTRDPQFGPVVMFGLGGIYTEVWRDVALRVAPVTPGTAMEMIRGLRAFPLLAGARGGFHADLQALAGLIACFSRLPFAYPEVGEIDLNPLFVTEDNLVVGDARVIRRQE
jgi:acetate---CoA ligase (ADP-forming)